MKIILRLIVLAIVLGMSTVDAAAQLTKPYEPQCDHNHIDSMVGTVAMSLGIERVVGPTMACLLRLWREDRGGTTKNYESAAFLAIMDQNPQVFFMSMAKEPQVFGEWLDRLGADSFTWPFDPPCQLEARRQELIAMLERAAVSPSLSTLKDAVKKRLFAIRCRQIN